MFEIFLKINKIVVWIIWQRAPDTVVCFIDEYYLEVNAAVSIFIKYPEQLVKEHFTSISLDSRHRS